MSDLVRCPSRRLLDSIWSTFKNMQGEESEETGEMTPANKIMLMSMINFNPEPLMVEIFPQSQGWPFPSYIGSCGRFVVMDYEGRTLSEFYDAAWSIRINLAYQVFEIAEHFTNNAEDYALYMTDIVAENFAVTKDGDVKLIDIENIIVVDKKMIREDKPENWDQKLASIHDDCVNSPNCLSFSDHDLCTHVEADHNYYAACHSLIASDAWIGSKPGGLLHDIPENIKKNTDLEHLLNECQNPTETNGRFTTAPQLLSLLQKLSNRM
ncbi:divergent protein kinase domain 2A-like [Glandiceps talaboti]